MLKIFFCVSLGFMIGAKGNLSAKAKYWNHRLQTVWLLILIFSMGFGIGANRSVLESLPVLGVKAAVFAVFASIGSILAVYLVSKVFFKEEEC